MKKNQPYYQPILSRSVKKSQISSSERSRLSNSLNFNKSKLLPLIGAKVLIVFLLALPTLESVAQKNCLPSQTFNGEGTYYGATGAGNCSFDATPNDLLVGALNNSQYGNADFCGACARIKGPKGEVKVRIVDKCPECKVADIDLSPQAFDFLAARSAGRIPISWIFEPCDISGNLQFKYKEGSSQWWIGIQVRNHRYAIKFLEYKNSKGEWITIQRKDYNYFIAEGGIDEDKNKKGPYTFRITDVHDQVVEESEIPFHDSNIIVGKNQFPVCKPSSRLIIENSFDSFNEFSCFADESHFNIQSNFNEKSYEMSNEKSNIVKFRILDVNGKLVSESFWDTKNNPIHKIDSQSFTKGVYLIEIEGENRFFRQRIIRF